MNSKVSLLDKCHINSNIYIYTFVGIKMEEGDIKISFPLGYNISKDEKELRKEILNLFDVLSKFTDKKQSIINNKFNNLKSLKSFPVSSYLKIILNYLNHGYYYENEVRYKIDKHGKINWSRTIKTQKVYIKENEAHYFDFVVKDTKIKKDALITQIHKYCVYESFIKLGWLYTNFVPMKPHIKFNRQMFLSIIQERMGQTFNDETRELFLAMINIIKSISEDEDSNNFMFGTNRFEYVWEKIIDTVYGINNKEEYFPKTTWELEYNNDRENNELEPDTIMIVNNKIYVLDAKYYKYGATKIAAHLPNSASINKQITYGEYIAQNKKFEKIYNAFIMPYDKNKKIFLGNEDYKFIGTAKSQWKNNDKSYECVQGILLDIKHIMNNYSRLNIEEIEKLSQIIEKNDNINR